jgi:predicted transcriptional regulator
MGDPTIHDYGERWDDSDVSALVERRRQGESLREIAGAMGRTVGAVEAKLHRLRAVGVDVTKGEHRTGVR